MDFDNPKVYGDTSMFVCLCRYHYSDPRGRYNTNDAMVGLWLPQQVNQRNHIFWAGVSNIYFFLTKVRITRHRLPSALSMISGFVTDAGGGLGLWLGLSFVQVIEATCRFLFSCKN